MSMTGSPMWTAPSRRLPAGPRTKKDPTYEYTDKGATTEIYVDEVNETVTVVKINYYLAEITDIRSDDDGEFATVRMLGTQDPLGDSVDTRKIYCKGFAEDDYVVVTVDVDEDGDAFVATINDPATAEGTVTRVKKDADPGGGSGQLRQAGRRQPVQLLQVDRG